MAILWLLAVRTCFFACFNYLTFHIYNQSCIVFIYILYIILQIKEKEPLPQLVEVLSHAAARAATFLVFAVIQAAFHEVKVYCNEYISILRSRTDCDQSGRCRMISILCNRVDYIVPKGIKNIRCP